MLTFLFFFFFHLAARVLQLPGCSPLCCVDDICFLTLSASYGDMHYLPGLRGNSPVCHWHSPASPSCHSITVVLPRNWFPTLFGTQSSQVSAASPSSILLVNIAHVHSVRFRLLFIFLISAKAKTLSYLIPAKLLPN